MTVKFPFDPLEPTYLDTIDHRRRLVVGVLESYNSNYDVFAESCQNAVDAVEDAFLKGLESPFLIHVTVNLKDNWLSVLDTGVGMSTGEMAKSVAPSVSFKDDEEILRQRGSAHAYRGYKGVGMTFLAYGTDDFVLHTKRGDEIIKARLRYGRSWAYGERDEPSKLIEDTEESPLESHARGTYVRMQLSGDTRPRSLRHIAPQPEVWETILRTRTAVGQILLDANPLVAFNVQITVIDTNGDAHNIEVEPSFIWPHKIEQTPPYRMLDLNAYYRANPEKPEPDTADRRQDGIYCHWDVERIREELSDEKSERHSEILNEYEPSLYGFLPYQGSLWTEFNEILSGSKARTHLRAGLVVAVSRQRIADVTDIDASRFETLSRNVLAVVHFRGARPDQGRKTLQEDVMELAQAAADRAVQYLASQRTFLRPSGEAPTPGQRQVERNHADWMYNVKRHAEDHPLHLPPVAVLSEPLTEQDVVGLFHELAALGVFPGIRIFATSQSKTYDCLVEFNLPTDASGLKYVDPETAPLGLSSYILGEAREFTTRQLTLEFKNNLDGLIADLDSDSPKDFEHIDICVCWDVVADQFPGYRLEEIVEKNLDERQYPGVTHVLRKDGSAHITQVVLLSKVTSLTEAGSIEIATG